MKEYQVFFISSFHSFNGEILKEFWLWLKIRTMRTNARLVNRSEMFPFIYYSFSLRKITLGTPSHEKEVFSLDYGFWCKFVCISECSFASLPLEEKITLFEFNLFVSYPSSFSSIIFYLFLSFPDFIPSFPSDKDDFLKCYGKICRFWCIWYLKCWSYMFKLL